MTLRNPLFLPASATGRLFEAFDWHASSLGPLEGWPPSLKVAVQMCLNSHLPMTIVWGKERINLYNDGYIPILGAKHPDAFGRPVSEVYPEIWDFLGPRIDAVIESGESFFERDYLIPLIRDRAPEECYFTFCYSPLADEHGVVRGFLSTAVDTTDTVIERRRRSLLQRLDEVLADSTGPAAFLAALPQPFLEHGAEVRDVCIFSHGPGNRIRPVWASPGAPLTQVQHALAELTATGTPEGVGRLAGGFLLSPSPAPGGETGERLHIYLRPRLSSSRKPPTGSSSPPS